MSYLFAMIKPLEGTLVEKRLQQKYFSVDFIGTLYLKMLVIIVRDVIGVNS